MTRPRLARLRRPDAIGAVRRGMTGTVDGLWAPAVKRLRRSQRRRTEPDAEPRVALITVNFSTTRYLKLMLATFSEQTALDLVSQLVIVDNGSRDGGPEFLRSLARTIDRVTLVERRHFLTHAHGMREGAAAVAPDATHLLFCDSDVIWRNPDALLDLMAVSVANNAALAGEIRAHGPSRAPDIQASLFLVRRDGYEDKRTPPPIATGSPAYRMQRAIFDRGLTVVNFPTNHGGYALHRGRSGVAAATTHPRHSYARAVNREPHYMGVPDGAAIWSAVEARYADHLDPAAEPAIIDLLSRRLGK